MEGVQTEVLIGLPIHEILQKVKAVSADLLVLGAYGKLGPVVGRERLRPSACARRRRGSYSLTSIKRDRFNDYCLRRFLPDLSSRN